MQWRSTSVDVTALLSPGHLWERMPVVMSGGREEFFAFVYYASDLADA